VPFAEESALPNLARLATEFWPGALTVVVPRRPGLGLDLGGDAGHVGLRCPAEGAVQELCRRVGALATTSANRHQEPPCHSAEEVRAIFGDRLGYVLDGGRRDGQPSSVVALMNGAPRLLRAGPITLEEIEQVLSLR
jgi:tRNA threonylcarbamoyl adenosine modification protein (Sua5/YciO/YrdC/YwlC family)